MVRKAFIIPLLPLLGFLLELNAAQAEITLSEFLADNDNGIRDEDGDSSDWIEIYNPGPGAIDLAGYALSDDAARPARWIFPSRVLLENGYLVVFASNKNRRPTPSGELHTNFRIDTDGGYLALYSPTGTVVTAYTYPLQQRDISYGVGNSGTPTQRDLTPPAFNPGTQYNRIVVTGNGTATADQSLNSFDDGLAGAGHQQYLWYNFSERLGEIPPGHVVVDAKLRWQGYVPLFAGVSEAGTVPASIGVFPCPDNNKGIDTIATGSADQLTSYYATNTPTAQVLSTPNVSQMYTWDITPLLTQWHAQPAAEQVGEFILLNSAQPHWVAWDQDHRGPALEVTTTDDPTVTEGTMTPTPGEYNVGSTPAGPFITEVTDNIPTPSAGTNLTLSVRLSPFMGGAITNAQLVYRRMYNPAQSLPLRDDGTNGDALAGDGLYTAVIPGTELVAGEMLRWAFTATDTAGYSTRYPHFLFPDDSPEYIGTVPHDPSIVSNLGVLHWFMQNPSQANSAIGGRASLYYLGEFYDNVFMNLHGQSTSGPLFAKKSANIDFNRKFRFRWDPSGEAPRVKNINLLTNYADKTKMRHILAYEINRRAGVPAHFCVPVRVERNGAFLGTFDFVEDASDVYLDRAGLNPEGALYKMYNNMTDAGGADHSTQGAEKKNRRDEDHTDLRAFLDGLNQSDAAARRLFLYDHLDLPAMVNFMAGNTVTANIDLHAKNYYIYRDTGDTDEWQLLPWDLDLSLGRLWTPTNQYFDDGLYPNRTLLSGRGQNLVNRLYAIPEIADMVRRRMRTLHDEFLQPNSTPHAERWLEKRFAELETLFGNDAALDYATYQPTPPWKTPTTGTTSAFKDNTIAQELDRLRTIRAPDDINSYLYQRRDYVYTNGQTVPAQDTNAPPSLVFGVVESSPSSGDQDQEFIEIVNTNAAAVDISGWELDGGVDFDFAPGTVIAGNNSLYVSPNVVRFRARSSSPTVGEGNLVVGPYRGHISNLGENVILLDANGIERASILTPNTPTDWQRYLVISEILYRSTGSETAEFIELQNISTNVPLDLRGVAFTLGVEFAFSTGSITNLAPGEQVLVVRDLAAFESTFGTNSPVAGVFANDTALNNGGEVIKLEDPQSNTIAEFEYDNNAPWPVLAAGTHSLVLMNPTLDPLTHPLANPARWRASLHPDGTPGVPGGDATLMMHGALDNNDGDAMVYLLEYFFGTSDFDNSHPLPQFSLRSDEGPDGPRLLFTVLRDPTADAANWAIEMADQLQPPAWSTSTDWELQSETREPDGRSKQVWALEVPSAGRKQHARIRVWTSE